jgi:hypothetical protein
MDSITFERGQGCNAGNAANLDGISHDRPWLGASVWSGPARWRPRRGRRRVLNYGRCERGRGPSLACCFVVVVVPVLEWRGSRCGEGLGCRDRWKGGLAARNLTLKLPERGWVGCAVCARPSAVRACVRACRGGRGCGAGGGGVFGQALGARCHARCMASGSGSVLAGCDALSSPSTTPAIFRALAECSLRPRPWSTPLRRFVRLPAIEW